MISSFTLAFIFWLSLHTTPQDRYTAQFSLSTLKADNSVVLGWILPEAEPEIGFKSKNCVYQVQGTPLG